MNTTDESANGHEIRNQGHLASGVQYERQNCNPKFECVHVITINRVAHKTAVSGIGGARTGSTRSWLGFW